MNEPNPTCVLSRSAIHRMLDGDPSAPLTPDEDRALATHLETCAGCREAQAELIQMRESLAALPQLPLPAADLEAVLARTTRRPRRFWQRPAVRLDWRLAAAAALVVLAAFVMWPESDPAPSQAEIRQAEAEARLVFKLTLDALKRTQRVTVDEVLGGEVSPALRRVPVKLPAAPPARGTGSDT